MAEILFHPEAQDEYVQSLAWYQTRSARAAGRFEVEVERLLGLIKSNPEMFPQYDD